MQEPASSANSGRARPFRYLLVGATCAVLNNLIMLGTDWVGFHYASSTTAAFFLVTPIGFWLHSRFTFREPISWRSFGTFSLGVAAGFPLSLLLMALFCSGLHLPMLAAAPMTTVALLTWNYLSARFAISRRSALRLPG